MFYLSHQTSHSKLQYFTNEISQTDEFLRIFGCGSNALYFRHEFSNSINTKSPRNYSILNRNSVACTIEFPSASELIHLFSSFKIYIKCNEKQSIYLNVIRMLPATHQRIRNDIIAQVYFYLLHNKTKTLTFSFVEFSIDSASCILAQASRRRSTTAGSLVFKLRFSKF